MKSMYFIIIVILIIVAGVGIFSLVRFKNQNSIQKQLIGAIPYEQTSQQQKLLELSFSPYGSGYSDPPGVGTKITLYRSGKVENQQTSYKQEGNSYKPVPAIATTSIIQVEAITKIEDIIKQLMDKDCSKQPDNRSISLDIYWSNQKKTINSPNCDKEIIEINNILKLGGGISPTPQL